MNACITLSKAILANRRIMKAYYFLFLLCFDSFVSFITEVSSFNSASSPCSCSLSRFLTKSSVSLGELSEL